MLEPFLGAPPHPTPALLTGGLCPPIPPLASSVIAFPVSISSHLVPLLSSLHQLGTKWYSQTCHTKVLPARPDACTNNYIDKQAFFALLDEYFESRPHLVGGGGGSANGGATISSGGANIHIPPAAAKAAAASVASAAVSQLGGGGGRSVPPPPAAGGPPPIHSSNRPSSSAPASSPSADSGGGVTSRISAFGGKSLNKFASNSHVSGAMGKVGAGGLADKWSRPAPSTSTSSSTPSLPPPRNNASPPQPPPSRRVAGAPVEGLQTQKVGAA